MKTGYTHIVVILDRSQSMDSVREATINGFNEFLKTQKKLPGEATISLVQFNSTHETTYENKNLLDAPELTEFTYIPDGMTAMNDAIGDSINRVGAYLRGQPEHVRPSKILFMILTDGQENSSKRFSGAQVKSMIEHQRGKYSWEFVFMGANQDVVLTAKGLGIITSNAMAYDSNVTGTAHVFATASAGLGNYRGHTRGLVENFFDPAAGAGVVVGGTLGGISFPLVATPDDDDSNESSTT